MFLDILLNLQDISSIITDRYDFDAFKKALNIDDSQLLICPKDDDSRKKAMMLMLLLWEKQTENPTKYSLLSTLRENGCDSIAVKLERLDSQKSQYAYKNYSILCTCRYTTYDHTIY